MDCLRSFTITIDQNRTFTNTTNQIKNWGAAGNYHWVVVQQASSVFTIEGFKRIDLYGIEMVGYIQTTLGPNDGGIVEDYAFKIGLSGQTPLVSGSVQAAPNDWAINPEVGQYFLGKYNNKISFESPFSGVTGIGFSELKVQGNNGETLNSLNLDINLVFKFLYKFDGE
jgi:hypothetical protein